MSKQLKKQPTMVPDDAVVDDVTVALQVQGFLDEWNYQALYALAGTWDHQKATIAALNLFVMHGVDLSTKEIQEISALPEDKMIDRVVQKMSNENKAGFEHFALQLQMITATTTRVRRAIESGQATGMEEALGGSATDSGLSSQILKKAIVQGGVEVATVRHRHETWKEATDARISRLVQSADSASSAQQQLKAIQEELAKFGVTQNDKSKKLMMGVALNNQKALVASSFAGWFGVQQKEKAKNEIRKKFEAELEAKEQVLIEYRKHQLMSVRAVFERKAAESDGTLLREVFDAWLEDVADCKRERDANSEAKMVEAKLAAFASTQAEKAQKVMRQMIAGNEAALCAMVFSGWNETVQEEKKRKELEAQAKAMQEKMAAHLAKKKDEARAILDRMNCATDSGLQEHVFQCWVEAHKAEMNEKRLAEIQRQKDEEFAKLNARRKDGVLGLNGRVTDTLDQNTLLKHFSAWALDSKLQRIATYYTQKMEYKKQQLSGVQSLFRNFASQLDAGLAQDPGMPPPPQVF